MGAIDTLARSGELFAHEIDIHDHLITINTKIMGIMIPMILTLRKQSHTKKDDGSQKKVVLINSKWNNSKLIWLNTADKNCH